MHVLSVWIDRFRYDVLFCYDVLLTVQMSMLVGKEHNRVGPH